MSPLKSISRVFKENTDKLPTVTQRCVMTIRPKLTSKNMGALFVKAFLSNKPNEKKITSLQFDLGDIAIEFFGKLIEEICELLVGYRELYCMRDIRPIKKIKEEFKRPKPIELDIEQQKEESIQRLMTPRINKTDFDSEQIDENLDEAIIPNISLINKIKIAGPQSPNKAKVAPIFTKIDNYFAENSAKIKTSFGEISISLYENYLNLGKVMVKSIPFVHLILPASNISISKEGEKLNANILGISLICTKQASITAQFWTVFYKVFTKK